MMKVIEANIIILKNRIEEMKGSQNVAECLHIQGVILEGMLETLELFYKLVTQ
ncbi:hypothetical protein ES705_36407 [subsurface metagenome]